MLRIEWLIFFSLFFLTLKFEEFNNLILLIFFIYHFKDVYIKLSTLKWYVPVFIILSLSLLFYQNIIFLKYILYIIRFLLIIYLFNRIIKLKNIQFDKILSKIYFIHVFVLIACYIFPSLNILIKKIFSFSNDFESFRFSGLISGYDFVSYIVLIYLSYEFYNLKFKINSNYFFKLLLGIIAIILSGRFGLIPLSLLLLFIFYKTANKIIITSFVFLFLFVSSTFFTIYFDNIYQTFLVIRDFYYDTDINLSTYNFERLDGQYNFSFITLYNEIVYPFIHWDDYILPTNETVVDPGPSYLIMNLGYIISFILYFSFFKIIKIYFNSSIPTIVLVIFILIDLKFRSIYVLLPTTWLLANQVNYIKKNEI